MLLQEKNSSGFRWDSNPVNLDSVNIAVNVQTIGRPWFLYLITYSFFSLIGLSQNITCAAFNCFNIVDDKAVMNLVSEDTVKVRYRQSICRSYVNCNKRLRWCPGRDCDKVIKVSEELRRVTCNRFVN